MAKSKRDKRKAKQAKKANKRATDRATADKRFHASVRFLPSPRWYWEKWDPELAPRKVIEGYGDFDESKWTGDRIESVKATASVKGE